MSTRKRKRRRRGKRKRDATDCAESETKRVRLDAAPALDQIATLLSFISQHRSPTTNEPTTLRSCLAKIERVIKIANAKGEYVHFSNWNPQEREALTLVIYKLQYCDFHPELAWANCPGVDERAIHIGLAPHMRCMRVLQKAIQSGYSTAPPPVCRIIAELLMSHTERQIVRVDIARLVKEEFELRTKKVCNARNCRG